jgi:hypothetical protein
MTTVRTAPSPDVHSRYAEQMDRVKDAVSQKDEGKIQKAIEALGAYLKDQVKQNVDITQLPRQEDQAVVLEVRERVKDVKRFIPGNYLEAIKKQSKHAAGQEPAANAGAQLAGADVQNKVNAAVNGAPAGADAGKAAYDSVHSTLEALAAGGVGRFVKEMKGAYTGPEKKGIGEALEKARAAAMNTQIQAGMIDNRPFDDALRILTDQPVSKELQPLLEARAKKQNKSVDQVRADLKTLIAGDLAKNRDKILDGAKTAFDALFEADPDMVQRLGNKKEAAAIFDQMKTLKPDDPKAAALFGSLAQMAMDLGPAPVDFSQALGKVKDPEVRGMLEGRMREQRANDVYYRQNYEELMALINAPLPIEMIVMAVMAKLGERAERKLRDKMKDLALVEYLEKKVPIDGLDGSKLQLHDFGLSGSQAMMQQLQIEQTQWANFMNALSGVMKSIEDMIATPIRNMGR